VVSLARFSRDHYSGAVLSLVSELAPVPVCKIVLDPVSGLCSKQGSAAVLPACLSSCPSFLETGSVPDPSGWFSPSS